MLKGLAISDFRSIGESQRIAPLGKINIFVGPNNSGKSNILRYINRNLINAIKSARLDKGGGLSSEPHLDRDQPTTGAIGFSASAQEVAAALRHSQSVPGWAGRLTTQLFGEDLLWVDTDWPQADVLKAARGWLTHQEWDQAWSHATQQSGGGIEAHWIPDILKQIRKLIPRPVQVYEIPVSRQADYELQENGEPSNILGGRGAIRHLAAMENPRHAKYDSDRGRFEQVQEFVRVVTDDTSAKLTVPHSQDEILVRLKNQKPLPLADLGSGIEQVVLHAIAATSAENAVVTFEEPELHLHPVLQRQLLNYLTTETTNQYFIATHSAHIIDALHANVFQVRLEVGETRVTYANTDAARYQICSELGYRPSDIVQANCIIWVEGPSDRIYLNHWLRSIDPVLLEDIHYSIMFYGGKLLSHLTAGATDDLNAQLESLIKLRLLNRQMAVVLDSDFKKQDQQISGTKRRVVEEIRKHGGFAWITDGREIENYVPTALMKQAVGKISSGREGAVRKGKFETVIPTVSPNSRERINKVKLARMVSSAECDLSRLDLGIQISALSNFVRSANGLAPLQTTPAAMAD